LQELLTDEQKPFFWPICSAWFLIGIDLLIISFCHISYWYC